MSLAIWSVIRIGGSGTTAAVAHALGRNFVGSELDGTYYKQSFNRLQKVLTNA